MMMRSSGLKSPNAQGKTFFSQPMHEKERYLAGSSGAGYTKLLTQALGEGKRDHKGDLLYTYQSTISS